MAIKFNKNALKKMTAPKQRRRVRISIEYDIEATESDEQAQTLVTDNLIVDCWLAQFVTQEVLDVRVIP